MLVIDETLYPYCGHIGFKQYISNKPAKYSLLCWGLCDSSLPYTYYSLPYAGKPKEEIFWNLGLQIAGKCIFLGILEFSGEFWRNID